ncbi:MAG: DUF4136 domain-containing protein [Acidobacteriaceae bacterium]
MKFRATVAAVSLLTMLMCLAPIAEAQAVKVNWRTKAPFSALKTYSWVPNLQNSFYRQFVVSDVNAALARKGLTKVAASQHPDLKVVYHFTTQEVMNSSTTSDGFGWGGGDFGGWGGMGGFGGWGDGMGMGDGGMITTESVPQTMGILTVDLVETKSNQVIWRGQATEDNVSSKQSGDEKQVEKSVDKMFDKFPPKESK